LTSGESISRPEAAAAFRRAAASAEAELVLRAQKRNPDAWNRIFDENYDRLFRYAYARVGHRETAEDLVSTVFLEAAKSIGGYRPGDRPLLAWLYTIARNVVNQHHRKRLRRGPGPIAIGDASIPAPEGSDASRIAERLDLMDAVGRLPESQREVLVLHHFVGLTIPEIARLLGKHERAVYSLQARALQGVRRRLGENQMTKIPRGSE